MDRVTAQLALELIGRALGDHLAAVDDRQPRGELVGLLQVVGRQQHGLAAAQRASARDLLPHLGADLGVEPGRRLVEEQHLRVVDERHRDVQPPLHPARVAARDPVGRVRQPEALEQLAARRSSAPPAHAVELTLEPEVLAAGGLDVDPRALRDHADRAADPVGLRDHVDPRDGGRPSSGCASVVRIFTAVDLPAPLGPSSPKIVPGSTANDSPSSAVTPFGYVFTRPSASIAFAFRPPPSTISLDARYLNH